jgi:hypothetical protein
MNEIAKTDGATDNANKPFNASQPDDQRAGQERPSEGRAKSRVATEHDCLAALSQLPALMTFGLVDVKLANAFKGIYATILQHYQRKTANSEKPTLDRPGLLDMLRKHPDLANMLEPMLSKEQIEALMQQGQDRGSETS